MIKEQYENYNVYIIVSWLFLHEGSIIQSAQEKTVCSDQVVV